MHSKNFCILAQIWKFSNLGGTLSRFLAIWFLQILHRRDFQSYYLDNQFIQNDHHIFNLIFILIESNLAGMRSRRCLLAPQTRWMDNFASQFTRIFPYVSCFVIVFIWCCLRIYKRCKCWKILTGQSPVLWGVHGWTHQGRKAFQASFVFFCPGFVWSRSTIPFLCWFLDASISWLQVVIESVIDFFSSDFQ